MRATVEAGVENVRLQAQAQLDVATKQDRATVVSTSRQNWINDVRNCVVDLAVSIGQLDFESATYWPTHARALAAARRMDLLLNPDEPES